MIKQTKKMVSKEKLGTILDKEVVKKIKKRASVEGRTISEIIQDAVLKYEGTEPAKLELRKEAVKRFCSKPFNITDSEMEELLTEDYYEQ